MRCLVCSEDELMPLWGDGGGATWYRCRFCGSDSAARHRADPAWRRTSVPVVPAPPDWCAAHLTWFDGHRDSAPCRDFLEVGCFAAATLASMLALGWDVHGFAVDPCIDLESLPDKSVTIAIDFRANLFPHRYAAILLHERLERTTNWRDLLAECHAACRDGALFQVQTPRPCQDNDPRIYHGGHLQLAAPLALRYWLERVGFTVLDYQLWPAGQRWFCKKD